MDALEMVVSISGLKTGGAYLPLDLLAARAPRVHAWECGGGRAAHTAAIVGRCPAVGAGELLRRELNSSLRAGRGESLRMK